MVFAIAAISYIDAIRPSVGPQTEVDTVGRFTQLRPRSRLVRMIVQPDLPILAYRAGLINLPKRSADRGRYPDNQSESSPGND